MSKLTHLDESGAARMVNVGGKPRTDRRAVASGRISMSAEAFLALSTGAAAKGDVLAVARIAGIMAAKRTSELIPLCHNIPLASVSVSFECDATQHTVDIFAVVENIDRTGVEMEALTAVSLAALTIYDMLKAVDSGMVIGEVHVVEKSGGMHVVAESAAPVTVISGARGLGSSIAVVPKGMTLAGPPSAVPVAQETERQVIPEPPSSPPSAAEVPSEVPSLRSPDAWKPRPEHTPEALANAARVQELGPSEHGLLSDFLGRDRVLCAYLLGDLDVPYVEHARWFALPSLPRDGAAEGLEGVLLLYGGLSVPAVLTAGSPMAIESLLIGARNHLPRRFYRHVRADHVEPFETMYLPHTAIEMIRMGLERGEATLEVDTADVEPLSHRDTAAIMQLYRHYPDNFFEPAQLETGLYFGVRKGKELVSVAGLHVYSERFDVAVLGNIVTHTEHRGQGLAARCVSRVLSTVFDRVSQVALNVQRDNSAAISCYRKFGFREYCGFVEGWVQAR